ncbi:Reverse transcriptase (RNA-dependent DNA polymerase) [Popillia japonica]|uniref:Reverse transcriptase (RNA-dependent DNA polymerase) n=1 Tax=Popillia japonica TaxID=7064 RepID=A0AAW1LTC9_POPJA
MGFKTKRMLDGSTRYKARLVVKGCAQRKGLGYEETYTPVMKYDTLRYLLAIAVQEDMEIEQMDAVSAFLQGDLKETIFMEQPENYQRIKVEGLIKMGFKKSNVDSCLYHLVEGDKKLFIGVYGDDLIFVSNNKALIKKVKNLLKEEFTMKDIGEIKSCLGFRITRDRINGKLQIDQEEYLKNVLERFNMSACNPVSTSVDLNVKLDKFNPEHR